MMEAVRVGKFPGGRAGKIAGESVAKRTREDRLLLLRLRDTLKEHRSLTSLNRLTDLLRSWCNAFFISTFHKEGARCLEFFQ